MNLPPKRTGGSPGTSGWAAGERHDRELLKLAILRRLDEIALEHPIGHQGRYAARYVLIRPDGERIELMFEKSLRTPANLWIAERHVMPLVHSDLVTRRSTASSLYASGGGEGALGYGRHSALKPMRQLANADLICITLTSLDELERVIEMLGVPAQEEQTTKQELTSPSRRGSLSSPDGSGHR